MNELLENYAKLFVENILLHYDGSDIVHFFNDANTKLINKIKELEIDKIKRD